MKILVVYLDIDPDYFPGMHHGLAYLLGYIKGKGYAVEFVHIHDTKEFLSMFEKLNKFDVLGISITTSQLVYFDKLMSEIPYNYKGKVVAGGVHPTLMYEELLRDYSRLDTVFVGEGEKSFCDYLSTLKGNGDLKDVEGVAYRKPDGSVKLNNLSSYLKIEDLGYPDYSIYDCNRIISASANTFAMMLGRGCPYKCTYCGNHVLQNVYTSKGGYVRLPQVDYSINVIKQNLSLYPKTKAISFADDTFTLSKKWLAEFCVKYKKAIGLPFDCNGRIETIDTELLKNLKKANCIILRFGIESGSEWLRRNILKRMQSNGKIIEVFKMVKDAGIKTSTSTLTGLPFESQQMFEQTYSLIRKIKPNFGTCSYVYPFPKTRLLDMCEEYKLLADGYDTDPVYTRKPSIKPIFLSNKQMAINFSKLRFYFELRIISSRFLLIEMLEDVILFISKPFQRRFVRFMAGRSKLKDFVRKIGYIIKDK